jgi:hypothetical protein
MEIECHRGRFLPCFLIGKVNEALLDLDPQFREGMIVIPCVTEFGEAIFEEARQKKLKFILV